MTHVNTMADVVVGRPDVRRVYSDSIGSISDGRATSACYCDQFELQYVCWFLIG